MSTPYVRTFSLLGAKLRNVQWSFAARGRDGAIVLSCWAPFFVPRFEHGLAGVMRYRDTLSRVAHNPPGSAELAAFLTEASECKTPFRMIISRPGDEAALSSKTSASHANNKFHARSDLIGTLVSFDGDEYVIDFRRN